MVAVEPGFLVIGRVVRPHGVRGEMRVESHTELPERFTWLEQVYLARDPDDPDPERHAVDTVRFHKGYVLLALVDVNSRESAEMLRGAWLMVPVAEALPLEEGEVYHYQLEGLEVVSDEGEYLGELAEIIETGANEVFVVRHAEGELLLPNIEAVVKEVDLEAGRMTVHLMEGLR
ncbi:MAG: ribosome maturation factor RimM [Candidatus Promineifilaceae bacterium]|nr:ribosome maturation factor RimM [Candidatus Promineifilaceae bacterium]